MITRTIDCVIERRLLVSYRIDPERVSALLPSPFRPQLVNGHSVGGACFIRMGAVRPSRLPHATGLTTENAAHRFAVEWDDAHGTHPAVYVPRRDTNSRITAAMGSILFPGAYNHAKFRVAEAPDEIRIHVQSGDGIVSLSVAATPASTLTSGLFTTVDDAMEFFRRGALACSPSARHRHLDGVRLQSSNWSATPMNLTDMRSSLFDDDAVFPAGTCALDSALLMTNVTARWTADLVTADGIAAQAA